MTKNRYINTRMWRDVSFRKFTKDEKLLFLYLLTNPDTNIAGIYEIPLDQISLDTGISENDIKSIFKNFEKFDKIFYIDGWVFIKNFIKYQKINPKIEIGIENCKKEVPSKIYLKLQKIDSLLKPIDSISKPSNNNNKNYNNNYNKNIITQKKSSILSDSGLIFDFDQEKEKMQSSKLLWRKILINYWLIKDIKITSREMFKSAHDRDIKSSKSIACYEYDDIIGCMQWLKNTADYDWKLETIHKKIDWYLKNIKNINIKQDNEDKRKILSKDCKICKDGYILMVNDKKYEELLPCECIYSTISTKKLEELKEYIKKNNFKMKVDT